MRPLDPDSKPQDNPVVETEIIGTVLGDQPTNLSAQEPLPEIPGFRVISHLGRGGMGCVYLAEQLKLGRRVALKVIAHAATASDKLLSRFHDESRAVAAVAHPGVCQIYEVGEANGTPFLAMEYIDGETLSEVIRKQLPTTSDTAQFVFDIAVAIEACHQAGILHRDLKPANVMLTQNRTIKVMDFGLAKRLESQDDSHTKTGEIVGTPSYMAPEQASGIVKQFTPATDVYAIGTILYECLTGRPPFQTPNPMQTVMMVLTEDPVSPRKLQPKIPVDLETICLKCLQKKPAKRYPSAAELADDIQRFINNEPIRARQTPLWEQSWKWVRRHPTYTALAVMMLLLICGIAFGTSLHVQRLQVELSRSERLFEDSQDLGRWLVNEHIPDIARIRGGGEQQARLVERTLEHLEQLEQDISADEQLAEYIAQAYRRIAEVQADPFFATDSRLKLALESCENSLRIYDDLANITSKESEDIPMGRSEVLIMMARLNLQLGFTIEAIQFVEDARNELAMIMAATPQADCLKLQLDELQTTAKLKLRTISIDTALAQYKAIYDESVNLHGQPSFEAKRTGLQARILYELIQLRSQLFVSNVDDDFALLIDHSLLKKSSTPQSIDNPTFGSIAQSQASLAELYRRAGKGKEASDFLSGALEKQQRLVNEFPESVVLSRSLLAMLEQSVELEIAESNLEQALASAQRHFDASQELYLSSPMEFQDEHLKSLQLIGEVQRKRLRFHEAQSALKTAIEILEGRTDKHDQLLLAGFYFWQADLMVEAVQLRSIKPEQIKTLQEAIALLQQAKAIYEKHGEGIETAPESPYWKVITNLHKDEEELEQILLLSRERRSSMGGRNLPQLIGPKDAGQSNDN